MADKCSPPSSYLMRLIYFLYFIKVTLFCNISQVYSSHLKGIYANDPRCNYLKVHKLPKDNRTIYLRTTLYITKTVDKACNEKLH